MDRINLNGHFPIGSKVRIHELIIPGTVLETGVVKDTIVTEIVGFVAAHRNETFQAIEVEVLTEDGVAEPKRRRVWHQLNFLDHVINYKGA
ncbi:hypothetical protein F7U66_01470 [Vibrio parahaemolyticus]|nr:hypothetical protein [Vibrio parahaemolyticus]